MGLDDRALRQTDHFEVRAEDMQTVMAHVAALVELATSAIVDVEPAMFGAWLAATNVGGFYATRTDRSGNPFIFAWAEVPSNRYGQVALTVQTDVVPADWIRLPGKVGGEQAIRHKFTAVVR